MSDTPRMPRILPVHGDPRPFEFTDATPTEPGLYFWRRPGEKDELVLLSWNLGQQIRGELVADSFDGMKNYPVGLSRIWDDSTWLGPLIADDIETAASLLREMNQALRASALYDKYAQSEDGSLDEIDALEWARHDFPDIMEAIDTYEGDESYPLLKPLENRLRAMRDDVLDQLHEETN